MTRLSPVTFSIVLITHNRPQLLARAIDSVRQQEYSGWELIVVDDASTPPATVPETPSFDDRIRIVRSAECVGPARARIIGTQRATGSYLAYLDDDDYYLPDHLSTVARAMRSIPGFGGLFLVGMCVKNGDNGSVIEGAHYDVSQPILPQYWGAPVSLLPIIMPREAPDRVPPPEHHSPIEDFEWLFQLLLVLPVKQISDHTVVYVKHATNRTTTLTNVRDLQSRLSVLYRLRANPRLHQAIGQLAFRRQLTHQCLHWTRQCLRAQKFGLATVGAQHAFRHGRLSAPREWGYTFIVLLRTLCSRLKYRW